MQSPQTTSVNLLQVAQKINDAYAQLHHLPIFKQLRQEYSIAFANYQQEMTTLKQQYQSQATNVDMALQKLYQGSSKCTNVDLNKMIEGAKTYEEERTTNKAAQDQFTETIERMNHVALLCFDEAFCKANVRKPQFAHIGVAAVNFLYTENGLQQLITNQGYDCTNHVKLLKAGCDILADLLNHYQPSES